MPEQAYHIALREKDEIDLIYLLEVIWQDKWALLVMVALSLLVSLAYLGYMPKQYQVLVKLYPIDTIQLAPVLPGNGGKELGYGVNIQDVEVFYRSAINDLNSLEYQKQFWIHHLGSRHYGPLEGAALDDFLDFRESLHLTESIEEKSASIRLTGDDPVLVSGYLSGFLGYVSARVSTTSISKLLEAIDTSIERIDQAILQARVKAEAEISDRIADITEALTIATSLGIEEAEFDRLANVEITLFNSRQYLLGEKALTFELKALERRRDKDAFVEGLRELQAAKASLLADRERINRNISEFRPLVYPKSISPPLKPVGPNNVLIVAVAMLIGGILGIIVVLVRHGLRSYQTRQGKQK